MIPAQSAENPSKQPISQPESNAPHSWSGIVCSNTGDLDAILCPECLPKFPFRAGLAEIHDLSGAMDRKCALCGREVTL